MHIDLEDCEIETRDKNDERIEKYSISNPFEKGDFCIIATYIDVIQGHAYFTCNGELIGKVFSHPAFKKGFNFLGRNLFRIGQECTNLSYEETFHKGTKEAKEEKKTFSQEDHQKLMDENKMLS